MTISAQNILRSGASAAILAVLFLACATWNRAQVLVPRAGGGVLVVFADGDCHSRMQRAAMVAENPGTIIRAHGFENFPAGTIPHTTAPMDYLIAGLAVFVHPFDVAGAWISPLLGMLAALGLWLWARELDLRPRWPMLMLFTISPALTHAFALGRPDHQSLLVLLTTAALASAWGFARDGAPAWAWASGAAWGLALWVSWFEPLILLATTELARALVLRRAAWPPVWRKALLLAAGIALCAWALEGFRNPWPDPAVREFFQRWAAMLGELCSTTPATMMTWTGWLLVPAPLMLIWDYRRRRDPVALIALVTLAVVTALAGWQARWSPWLAAVYCLALPWMLQPLRKPWIVWTIFIASLWPVARAWEGRLFPPPAELARRNEKIAEAALLEQVAGYLRTQTQGGILAPWWISPALARMSGQPAVGGTSHQSLPGSVDTARFFLATDDADAAQILRARRVRFVINDAPERVVPTSAALLGLQPPPKPLAARLSRGKDIPPFLQPVFANRFFRVYEFRDE